MFLALGLQASPLDTYPCLPPHCHQLSPFKSFLKAQLKGHSPGELLLDLDSGVSPWEHNTHLLLCNSTVHTTYLSH